MKKKGVNPLLVGLGLAAGTAGALGALFFSKKENRKKAAKLVGKVKDSSALQDLVTKAKNTLTDMEALSQQKELDKPEKKAAKRTKKK